MAVVQLCAWRLAHRGPKFLRVGRWLPLWPIVRSHGICNGCRERITVTLPLRRIATRIRTAEWYTGRDDRQEIAHDIDAVIGRLERLAR